MIENVGERVLVLSGRGLGAATEHLIGAASKVGYTAAASGPGSFRLARTRRPRWATIGAIVGLPLLGLGLLFLLVKRTEEATASVFEDREGVKVRLVGVVDPRLVSELEGSLPASSSLPVAVGASWAPSGDSLAAAVALPPAQPDAPGGMVTEVPGFASTAIESAATGSSFAAPPSSLAVVDETVVRPHADPLPPGGASGRGFDPPAERDIDRTIARASLAPPLSSRVMRLVAKDGRAIVVGRGLVVGRQPDQDPNAPDASLTPLVDPSLSKTHATIAPGSGGVWVVDHHSTNGTTVTTSGTVNTLIPGTRMQAPVGSVLALGELELRVDLA